jgi:hypothetical protein
MPWILDNTINLSNLAASYGYSKRDIAMALLTEDYSAIDAISFALFIVCHRMPRAARIRSPQDYLSPNQKPRIRYRRPSHAG